MSFCSSVHVTVHHFACIVTISLCSVHLQLQLPWLSSLRSTLSCICWLLVLLHHIGGQSLQPVRMCDNSTVDVLAGSSGFIQHSGRAILPAPICTVTLNGSGYVLLKGSYNFHRATLWIGKTRYTPQVIDYKSFHYSKAPLPIAITMLADVGHGTLYYYNNGRKLLYLIVDQSICRCLEHAVCSELTENDNNYA